MQTRELLEAVRSGKVSVEDAEAILRKPPVEDIGCAKLDLNRAVRSGYPEVVFCQGKADEHLIKIFQKLYEANGEVLGTRASAEQYELVKEAMPSVPVQYDKLARIMKIEKPGREKNGLIAVCTAGTADIPVAEEAAQTAEFFGNYVERVYDVGVSGIDRRADTEGKLCNRHRRYGGGTGQCHRRSGGQAGYRGAYLCGIRGQLQRAVGIAHHDKFLCQRHCGSKY